MIKQAEMWKYNNDNLNTHIHTTVYPAALQQYITFPNQIKQYVNETDTVACIAQKNTCDVKSLIIFLYVSHLSSGECTCLQRTD